MVDEINSEGMDKIVNLVDNLNGGTYSVKLGKIFAECILQSTDLCPGNEVTNTIFMKGTEKISFADDRLLFDAKNDNTHKITGMDSSIMLTSFEGGKPGQKVGIEMNIPMNGRNDECGLFFYCEDDTAIKDGDLSCTIKFQNGGVIERDIIPGTSDTFVIQQNMYYCHFLLGHDFPKSNVISISFVRKTTRPFKIWINHIIGYLPYLGYVYQLPFLKSLGLEYVAFSLGVKDNKLSLDMLKITEGGGGLPLDGMITDSGIILLGNFEGKMVYCSPVANLASIHDDSLEQDEICLKSKGETKKKKD